MVPKRCHAGTRLQAFCLRPLEVIAYGLWIARLDELRKSLGKELMPFPDVFEKLCRNFQISKSICKRFLSKLWEQGFVEISSCHGVRLTEHAEAMLFYMTNKEEIDKY
jgi:hypothetical protein